MSSLRPGLSREIDYPFMNQIYLIYTLLHKRFGPQGWWPTTKKGKAKPEYRGGPSSDKEKLEVIFGAILTQYIGFNKDLRVLNILGY